LLQQKVLRSAGKSQVSRSTNDSGLPRHKNTGGTQEEKQCLRETLEEYGRRNFFKRIFPTVDFLYYKQFFEEERPLNYFID